LDLTRANFIIISHSAPRPEEIIKRDSWARSIQSMATVALLVLSNIFMTFAWYGHLKYTSYPLWAVIIVSWLIALPEYCFQVPANRLGYGQFSGVELKTIQEIISLTVFSVFSVLYLNEQFRWNYLIGFGFLVVGAFFIFKK